MSKNLHRPVFVCSKIHYTASPSLISLTSLGETVPLSRVLDFVLVEPEGRGVTALDDFTDDDVTDDLDIEVNLLSSSLATN